MVITINLIFALLARPLPMPADQAAFGRLARPLVASHGLAFVLPHPPYPRAEA